MLGKNTKPGGFQGLLSESAKVFSLTGGLKNKCAAYKVSADEVTFINNGHLKNTYRTLYKWLKIEQKAQLQEC